jgi:hypothetical protein
MLTFYPNCPINIDILTNLSLIASHSINFTYNSMKKFFFTVKNVTHQFKSSYLNLFPLAHAIRIVYASCQGEI